jgi:hypothetical protein
MAEELTLEWLGTGSAMNYELGNSNFLLSTEKAKVLVDLSAGNVNLLLKRGELADITDVIITHVHGDHVDGLEGLAFFSWNALERKPKDRPIIHIPTESMASELEETLKPKIKDQQYKGNQPFTADLSHYFEIKIGRDVGIRAIPDIDLFYTSHVQNMECFGINVPDYGLWISGDSRRPEDVSFFRDKYDPPRDSKLAFRDAGGPGNHARVHSDLELDLKDVPKGEKSKTFLYHVGGNWQDLKATEYGFAGIAMPGDRFILDGSGYKHDKSGTFIHQTIPYIGKGNLLTK